MIKHMILWKLKDEYSAEEKETIKAGIKEGLEGLAGKIPGLLDIHVSTDFLESATADAMLDSTFEDEAALKAYAKDPVHNAVADSRIRPHVQTRLSADYIL